MSVLIKGMEMPKNGHITITISDNGEVVCNSEVIGGKYQYRSYGRVGRAIPVPPHGALIDRDALPTSRVEWEDIVNAPTIIPAEEGE
jgi:hypothetical protein